MHSIGANSIINSQHFSGIDKTQSLIKESKGKTVIKEYEINYCLGDGAGLDDGTSYRLKCEFLTWYEENIENKADDHPIIPSV